MTPDEARELFSEAYEGELSPERREAFDAALEADPELGADWEEFRALLDGAHAMAGEGEGDEPDLLGGVQRKIRARSRGRFYRDRFAASSRATGTSLPLVLGVAMLLLLAVAWIMLHFVDVEVPSGGATGSEHNGEQGGEQGGADP